MSQPYHTYMYIVQFCLIQLHENYVLYVQAQYVFIHDALEELITCGDTSFNVQNMRVKVNRMSKVNPETEITGYQKQFQVQIGFYNFVHD